MCVFNIFQFSFSNKNCCILNSMYVYVYAALTSLRCHHKVDIYLVAEIDRAAVGIAVVVDRTVQVHHIDYSLVVPDIAVLFTIGKLLINRLLK